MGTRALIGYLDINNGLKLTSTYNHYDGYPENLGRGLKTWYNTDAKAEEIANAGYISYLDAETGEIEATNTASPKITRLPNNFEEAMEEIAGEIDHRDGNYGYIWCEESGEWSTIKNNGINRMTMDLMKEFEHIRSHFGSTTDQNMADFLLDKADEDARLSEKEVNELFVRQMQFKAGIIK